MDWLYLINLGCVFFSLWVASTCKEWSLSWWFNMFASALNVVIVLDHVI